MPEALAQAIAFVLEMLAVGTGLAFLAFFRVLNVQLVYLPIYLQSYIYTNK
jgi:hypothetical protein